MTEMNSSKSEPSSHEHSNEVPPARIYFLLARDAPTAVVFRRGPTDWVQVVRWDTSQDIFEAGQWFHGRIYQRRSDISPDGSLLIYFASKITGRTLEDDEYTYAWTAISRPPYLTALALWPKRDCWHGGGLFETNSRAWLNHKPEVAVPHPDHKPVGLEIKDNPEAAGEDWPVWSRKMERDGWEHVQVGSYPYSGSGWKTNRRDIWQRDNPVGEGRLTYALDAIDFNALGGPYVESFSVGMPGQPEIEINDAVWADWDQSGRLVFARKGRIFEGEILGVSLEARELIDLNPNRPQRVEAPGWATRW